MIEAHLLVIQGADLGERFEIDETEVGLGRGVQNRIRVHDTEASRTHARIVVDSGRVILSDLNSSNGTYVNGEQIRIRELVHGDEVQIGRTLLRFSLNEAAEPSHRVAERVDFSEGREVQTAAQIVGSADVRDVPSLPKLAGTSAAAQSLANLQVLYRIAEEAVRPSTSIESLLSRILDLALEVTGADRGCTLLREHGDGTLRPVAYRDRRDAADTTRMPVSRSIVDYVVKSRQGVRTSDARSDARFAPGQSILQAGIREAICVPMQGRYDLQGVIYLDITTAADVAVVEGRTAARFNEDLLRLMVAVGRQAALAVEDNQYQQALVKSERLAAVGQTITILSHHIKNILQGVRGGSYLIDMGLKDHDETLVRKGWTIVEKNQGRIYQLVMDMLTLSKERQPVLKPADLNATVADVCELVQARADESHVRLVWSPSPGLPPMMFDPEAMHRAVLNLVGNALDAVEGGERPIVSVTTDYHAASGAVSVVVADNGAGIAPEVLPTLFNIFESTKGGKGTGIGLAVSQKIVREHGGEIYVESEPGRGAKFALEWPIITEESGPLDRRTEV